MTELTKDQQSLVDRLRWCLQNGVSCTIGADEVHIPMNAIEEVARLNAELAAMTKERDAAVSAIERISKVDSGDMSKADDLRQHVYGVARIIHDWRGSVAAEGETE